MKDFKRSGGFGGNRRSSGGGDRPRGGFGGGRPSFGGRGGGGGGRSFGDRPQMFKATCANCGKECEVPFRPNGEKPVYCNDCFGKNSAPRESAPRGGFENREFSSPRPAFKSEHKNEQPTGSSDETKKLLSAINTKLDKLIDLMSTNAKAKVKEANDADLKVLVNKAQKVSKEAAPAKKKKAVVKTKKTK